MSSAIPNLSQKNNRPSPPLRRHTKRREWDLSPIVLTEIPFDGKTLRFRQPLRLTPEVGLRRTHICVRLEELEIDLFARTREDLLIILEDQIGFLWKRFALADDEHLTTGAQKLKLRLLEALEETTDG